jgi:hypothetical protein
MDECVMLALVVRGPVSCAAGMISSLSKHNQQRHVPTYEWADEAEAIVQRACPLSHSLPGVCCCMVVVASGLLLCVLWVWVQLWGEVVDHFPTPVIDLGNAVRPVR